MRACCHPYVMPCCMSCQILAMAPLSSAAVCLWIAAVYGAQETELSKTGAPAPTAPETLSPESKNRLRLLHARFKQALGRPERS